MLVDQHSCRGSFTVFGCAGARSGAEPLVVLAETRETEAAARAAVRESIVRLTVDVLGEPPDHVHRLLERDA